MGSAGILAGAARAPTVHRWWKSEISMLQKFGVAQTDITKMKAGGFHTVEAIWQTPTKELTDVKGMSEGKIAKIKDAGEASFHLLRPRPRSGAQKMLPAPFSRPLLSA